MRRTITLLAAAPFAIILLVVMSTALIAFPDLPPTGRTGAPGGEGSGTCNDSNCHNSFPLAVESNALTIDVSSIPNSGYIPGDTYSITVDLSQASAVRYGFQLTVLENAGNTFAGNLTAGSGSRVSLDAEIQYISHSFNPSTSGIWSFTWQAPLAGTGTVTFYATGNAANGFGRLGDVIHTRTVAVAQAIIDDVDEEDNNTPFKFRIRDNYPNPFNPSTTIRYEIDRSGPFTLKIYDIQGQEVKTLINTHRTSGSYEINWDATNNQGVSVASGVYIARMQSGSKVATSRLLLIK